MWWFKQQELVEVDVNLVTVDVLLVNHGEDVQLQQRKPVSRLQMVKGKDDNHKRLKESIVASIVKHNPKFTNEEIKVLIIDVLNEFRMCFAFNIYEFGCTNAITMDLVDNHVPVISKPYHARAKERDTMDKIVGEWKTAELVTETDSPYASSVLLVTKKNGELRLVVDYRKLNSQTVHKVYPTPNMDDHLEVLTEAKLFCILDLASGYL